MLGAATTWNQRSVTSLISPYISLYLRDHLEPEVGAATDPAEQCVAVRGARDEDGHAARALEHEAVEARRPWP